MRGVPEQAASGMSGAFRLNVHSVVSLMLVRLTQLPGMSTGLSPAIVPMSNIAALAAYVLEFVVSNTSAINGAQGMKQARRPMLDLPVGHIKLPVTSGQ